MYSLLYFSTIKSDVLESEIEKIWKKSQSFNAEQDITGMLIFSNGIFMQVLEGDKDNVESLFDAIEQDARHENIVALARETIPNRNFAEWSMAYKALDKLDVSPLEEALDWTWSIDNLENLKTPNNVTALFQSIYKVLIA